MAGGSCLTFTFANWLKKFWHSRTTKGARPLAPESSGYVVSLRRLARMSEAPSTLAHCGFGLPSPLIGAIGVGWPIVRHGKAAIRLQRPQDVSGHGHPEEASQDHRPAR